MKFELLETLARCRVVASSEMTIPSDVVKELTEEKLVVQKDFGEESSRKTIYMLTDKGEVYIKQNMPEIQEIYRGFVVEQDLALCDFYLRRNVDEKKSWITKDDLIKKYRLPGTVDGAFMNREGKLVGVKVLNQTANYAAVEKVEGFLKAAHIEFVHYIMFSK
ncbi:DNA-binding MarR family transcriptional regulator [Paenibacillus sp. 1182]|uniref:hypothetical protein n=1 Tax=Paenibacillus sp. 1182 TaxID=2806565 RepID=UPI001AE8C281|nr:hypothetical protein [Paenibacillus sp. 1182]MBP1308895.1 DNA-binding MarR family transcriptional regulator [Paenibacillus sp. 1182]